jgi:hypothetical protein
VCAPHVTIAFGYKDGLWHCPKADMLPPAMKTTAPLVNTLITMFEHLSSSGYGLCIVLANTIV